MGEDERILSKFTKKRLWLAIGLCVLIVCALGYILLNKDKVFSSVVTVSYPDHCIEKYSNGILVTPLCTNGRMLQQQIETTPQLPRIPPGVKDSVPTFNITPQIQTNVIVK